MKIRIVRVKVGDRMLKLRGVRGPDGLVVADVRGVEASEALIERTRRDFAERIKPKVYSPFRPFRLGLYGAR